jgi:hypothetical protein
MNEILTILDVKEFAKDIVAASQTPKSVIQQLPMRNGDIAKGCVTRFKLGTTY